MGGGVLPLQKNPCGSGLKTVCDSVGGSLEKLAILWMGGIFLLFFCNRKSTKNVKEMLRVGGPKEFGIL